MVFLKKPSSRQKPPSKPTTTTAEDQMISILADAGCTLINPTTPSLPPDLHKFRQSLNHLFTTTPSLLPQFISGFTSFTQTPQNLQTFLTNISSNTSHASHPSLLRTLLLIPSLQLHLQLTLLEKLPELFNTDIAPQIVNHFRYLDFIVDSKPFVDKLLQVLSVCPLSLKKDVIGSLPEIIGNDDKNNENVVDSLRKLLEEDSELIVPVLDSFSNLYLTEQLQEQVVTIAVSFIRTIDARHMPYLLRFLLLSATHSNARWIISQIRQQLKFVGGGGVDSRSNARGKGKGKSVVENFEGLVLEALRSSLQFKNSLCQEILNELKSIDKVENHRVIDVWLIILIYMNGGALQKTIEKMINKKIADECLHTTLFDQCIHSHRELVQDYFPSFLSLCAYLLACKEQKAREFGIHLYLSLFDEFKDTYSRHEILGGLVTHIGSGVVYEVGSALEAMVLLASKYSQELIPLSSYINGILDYIEGFSDEDLHKVYEVFSRLALSGRSNSDSVGSSIANELLIIVRKQVSNQDLKYKRMGLIGTLKFVSFLGHKNYATQLTSSQKTNCEESLELLRMCLDSCKSFPMPLVTFYDELIALLERTGLHPAFMDWIGKHVGDFESIYLSDLEGGQLLSKGSFCGLEGELWMNLDGDLSPICLNILPLVSSPLQTSTSLQVLPAYFHLLSIVEKLANQGSLGGIDALLGCPLWLPSPKYFDRTAWLSLTGKQKQAMCLSLYYASNWIRELINGFCTQVIDGVDCTSQTTREEIITKLLKRLRNLVFLECLLNASLKLHPLSLPELHFLMEHSGPSDKPSHMVNSEKKNERSTITQSNSTNKKLKRKSSVTSENDKLKQPTIFEVLRRAGAVSQEPPNEGLSDNLVKSRESLHAESLPDSTGPGFIEISAATKVLDGQRYKCRALSDDCLSILTFSMVQDACCSDPAAELPLHLHLLRDLSHKLERLIPKTKQSPASCLRTPISNSRVIANEFVNKIRKLFPFLKKHFVSAVSVLNEGDDTCQEHWKIHSTLAGNPYIPDVVVSKSAVAGAVFKEVLTCLSKMLNLPDVKMNTPVLSDLLKAFQPDRLPDNFVSDIQPIPSPGNVDYLYCGAYAFLEGVLDNVCSSSVLLASEVLVTLASIVDSAKSFLDKLPEGSNKSICIELVPKIIPSLEKRLGTCAHKLLMRNWDCENLDNGWKGKGDTIQKIVHIYFDNSECTADLLEEFACSILPQAPSCKTQSTEEVDHGFPTLCATTFVVWYRTLYEENHTILNKLVKEINLLEKSKTNIKVESVKGLLIKIQKSVNVVVSLVNMCKTHDKVVVHAMTVKYGGKFVDTFLKVFDFLQRHFQEHSEMIIQLVKELQKATRTIQTLCSDAKGSKRTMITTKIPATKRSMERFLFGVKALLYGTSNGNTFWMGNLKHKDLYGQVVSSQVYADRDNAIDEETQNNVDEEEPNDQMDEDEEQPVSICSLPNGDDEQCI